MRKCPYRREETKHADGSVTVSGEFAKCYERDCPFFDWDAAISIGGSSYCKKTQNELEAANHMTRIARGFFE